MINQNKYNIGIDTGGTYTDAVILDVNSKKILGAAKSITTHGDLSIGVSESLRKVLKGLSSDLSLSEIGMVCVSTTLATNALVEKKGSPVGSVLIGFDEQMVARSRVTDELNGGQFISVSGGHSHEGIELSSLDIKALRQGVARMDANVSAFAIASVYSVRNPAHEHEAQKIVAEISGKPVSLSCDLSSELDVPRRALTATLNAQIIAPIIALIEAIKNSLDKEGINGRLMIVKGDGSLASADEIIQRPIETIMSGPAASVIGSRFLSGLDDFVMADIGGTTSDIAGAIDGWPNVNQSGAVIGDYQTMVNAIDIQTSALGGDTEIISESRKNISLGHRRVVPLSLLGLNFNYVAEHLESALVEGRGLRAASRFLSLPDGIKLSSLSINNDEDLMLLNLVKKNPKPWLHVIKRKSDENRVHSLLDRGVLQMSCLTPSDAAHVLGFQSQWDINTAWLACRAFGQACGLLTFRESHNEEAVKKFAQLVIDKVVQRSSFLILKYLGTDQFSEDDPIIASVCKGNGRLGGLKVALKSDRPVIGVGGPAEIYYPMVGERLDSEVVIPKNASVANAIGAAVGQVRSESSIEISGYEAGRYLVHVRGDPLVIEDSEIAIQSATDLAIKEAEDKAHQDGGINLETTINIARVDLPDGEGFISARVKAVTTGDLVDNAK